MIFRPAFRSGTLLMVSAAFVAGSIAGAADQTSGKTKVVVTTPPSKSTETPRPAKLDITPASVALNGRRDTAQLIVNGTMANGLRADFTRDVTWASSDEKIVKVSKSGQINPVSDGKATVAVKMGDGLTSSVEVAVGGMNAPDTVSFRNDVIPAFSQANCNMGACHGTPTGKGGFKLSLRGYLPDDDIKTLAREAGGRRIDIFSPDASLVLTKPLGEVAHEGGLRLTRGTKSHEFIRDWIAEGGKDDPAASKAMKLEILPENRVLHEPFTTQQVAVRVTYADKSTRDVTPLAYYSSSAPEIADVDVNGFVTFKSSGEAAIIAHYQDLVAIVRLTHLVEVPGFAPIAVPKDNLVDEAVYAKLNRMRIAPSELCTDEEFLRRVYLDVIGVLPSVEERTAFLSDKSTDRRAKLIDSLLTRDEFYDYWTLKLADVLRSNARLIQVKGTNVFQRWIRESLQAEKPMDQFVRELLTADGSTFKNPAANYYRISRDPDSSVETTAQLFMGVRIQCAKCHNHPFEKWTQDDYYGFAAFFSRVRQKKGLLPDEEIIYAAADGDVRQPRTGVVMKPKALGGPVYDDATTPEERRVRMASWLTGPENPFFAKSMVNRVWFHLMGRGIVEPVDDFRDSNPACNDELIDGLAADFVKSGYSLKSLIRTIANSRTYQLSAKTTNLNAADNIYFSHAFTKLLPAEVLLDAIASFTASPTAFNGLPEGVRATQIPDGKMENAFLKTFGRPARELACECERESDSNLSQALQLIGGATVNGKLRDDKGRMAALAKSDKTPETIVKELYVAALSRDPSVQEVEAAAKHIKDAKDRRQAVEDIGWVLINSKEFLFRH
jgi:hypothetical protein